MPFFHSLKQSESLKAEPREISCSSFFLSFLSFLPFCQPVGLAPFFFSGTGFRRKLGKARPLGAGFFIPGWGGCRPSCQFGRMTSAPLCEAQRHCFPIYARKPAAAMPIFPRKNGHACLSTLTCSGCSLFEM